MTILNYTPHAIHMIRENGDVEVIPSSGVARCEEIKTLVGEINGFPVYSVSYGPVSGLPDEVEETIVIVSSLAANGAMIAGRNDCRIVADTVRNDKGQVIGAKGLAIV